MGVSIHGFSAHLITGYISPFLDIRSVLAPHLTPSDAYDTPASDKRAWGIRFLIGR
jgi:hypothetical protein